jgi:hypothetical protein
MVGGPEVLPRRTGAAVQAQASAKPERGMLAGLEYDCMVENIIAE